MTFWVTLALSGAVVLGFILAAALYGRTVVLEAERVTRHAARR